jgi:hypothetical protein
MEIDEDQAARRYNRKQKQVVQLGNRILDSIRSGGGAAAPRATVSAMQRIFVPLKPESDSGDEEEDVYMV